jgi:hypothetical protein
MNREIKTEETANGSASARPTARQATNERELVCRQGLTNSASLEPGPAQVSTRQKPRFTGRG